MGTFDPQSYAQLPHVDAAEAIALGTALVASAPPASASPAIAAALPRVTAALAALKTAWTRAQEAEPANATRAAHGHIDAAYANLHARLAAYAGLPVSNYPKAGRAAELLTLLFPDGLAFVRGPFKEEWAASDAILARVGTQNLQADIDALSGAEFLADARDAHQSYGEALGLTKSNAKVTVDVATPFDALKLELGRLTRAAVVLADSGTDAGLAQAQSALAPIDAFRAEAHTRKIAAAGKAKKEAADAKASPTVTPVKS